MTPHDPCVRSSMPSFGRPFVRPFSRPLSQLTRELPRPSSALFAAMLNVGLRRDLPDDIYLLLTGRSVGISVSDWRLRFRFVVTSQRFAPLSPSASVDLNITASARDFALLASGEEDPDTLYFDRRLVVEGDTELALLIKNTLDALPAPKMRKLIRILHRGLDQLKSIRVARGITGLARDAS